MSGSDSDEENVIRYGTPLEPYEEDELPSKRKYQLQPDQFATDAHGRRRFHGAFTGGFSAGFGNTVGTAEGWTPATFKSSRGDKAKISGQRPEDYMDEEDRSEFGIAPKHMQTQNEFSGRKRPIQQRYHDGPIPGEPVLEQLLRPVHETAAVRMLRAMGWKPGQGVGARVSKAQKKSSVEQHRVYGCYMPEEMRQGQRPEDYMDEEDRSEFGIAPKHMQTQNEFSGRKRPIQQRYHDGPIPGEPVLEQLLRPVHETAAVRMLRAMGWKPGQGVGARVSKAQKKSSVEQHRVYGCYMPEEMRQPMEAQSDSSDSEFEYDSLFAPDDYEPYILQRKSDRFGLGYSGLSRHSVLGSLTGEYGHGSTKSHLVMKDRGKKVSIRGQAFGVGALEADDEDIYATEDMSHYDFSLTSAPEMQKKRDKQEANVLEGFVRSVQPLPHVPVYPAPALPRDYTPLAAGARRSRFEPSAAPTRDQGLGRHELSAEARGALLGETPIPTPTPNEDPIAKLLGRNVNFATTDKIIDKTRPIDTEKEGNEDFISIKDSGKEITKVFKPFVSNPAKQARYEKYLKDKSSLLEKDDTMDRLSAWERDREISEFEQAAKLYKPLSGVMGDRFTHASEPDDALNPLTAVAKSSINRGAATPAQIEAAIAGAYGVLTRSEAPWRPESLVCKRFNVPEIGSRQETKKEDRPKVSYSIFNYMENSVHDKESFAIEQGQFSGSKSLTRETISRNKSNDKTSINYKVNDKPSTSAAAPIMTTEDTGFNKRLTVAELFLKESEKDFKSKEVVTETIDKFDKMDLYKSIFLSDSENEDDATKKDASNNEGASNDNLTINDFLDVPKNVERNLSPPRGIFANIDFDEINSWKRNAEKKAEENIEKVKNAVAEEAKDTNSKTNEDIDAYGPKIPDNLKKRLEEMPVREIEKPVFRSKSEREVVDVSSSSSDSWVEAKQVKSKKKKKKNKKHKKQKKSKHKKKDR